jgi:hypothetical protein
MRIKAILDFIKKELEKNFDIKKSYLKIRGQSIVGMHCFHLEFEAFEGTCISIQYWDTGTISISSGNIITNVDYVDYDYSPFDYQKKVYPKESETIFVKKMNELLSILNEEKPNIKSRLPNNI